MTSLAGLWTIILKPRVWHHGRHHLVFLEKEETVFGRVGEAGADTLSLYPDWI